MKSHKNVLDLHKRWGEKSSIDCYRKASLLKAVKSDHIIKSKSYRVKRKSIRM